VEPPGVYLEIPTTFFSNLPENLKYLAGIVQQRNEAQKET